MILNFPIERYRLDHKAAMAEMRLARAHYANAIAWYSSKDPLRVSAWERHQAAYDLLDYVRLCEAVGKSAGEVL